MMYFRKLIFVLAIVLFASSCTKQIDTTKPYKVSSNAEWIQELKQRNPLKDSANITSVYFWSISQNAGYKKCVCF